MIIIKTFKGAICGGYTTKDWDGSNKFVHDNQAFVFNLQNKFDPTDYNKAIFTKSEGFTFGDGILGVSGFTLNGVNMGACLTKLDRGYDTVEGDVSPLTNLKEKFTCGEIEAFKIIY